MLPRVPCPRPPRALTPGPLRLRRLLAAAALTLACFWPAQASDIFRECKPLDGDAKHEFDIEENMLRKVKGGPVIPFKTVDKQRLRQVTGYCNTKGGRFKFNTEIFGLTVEFTVEGKPVRQRFKCEMSEDATPAGLDCDTEVRLIDFKAPEKLREGYR
jgi:hypothetical protein